MIKRIKNRNLKKRHRAEKRFKIIGLGAILIAFACLIFLLFNIISNGAGGFMQTRIKLNIAFDASSTPGKMIRDALDKDFPGLTEYNDKSTLYHLVGNDAKFVIDQDLKKHPEYNGQTGFVWLPAEQKVDIYYRHSGRDWNKQIGATQQQYVQTLKDKGMIQSRFNWQFFSNTDSQEPEAAGIAGALMGTFFLLISCMLVALPIGIMTAIYLEEFAPKNRFTDFLEININNLAAVPSIVYGLLGLAVFLNFFGLPRSAPLVGGLTLSLMVIPVIIIATRVSLKAVPPSIRQAAIGLGASPLQVVLHHSLPLALPGVMTGTILGIARAMGETAPLLMIGMVAFIADVPHSFTDPATAMPVQIYLWSKNNQPGFVEKTAAAIMVLLAILIVLNIIAVWVRNKYERRW